MAAVESREVVERHPSSRKRRCAGGLCPSPESANIRLSSNSRRTRTETEPTGQLPRTCPGAPLHIKLRGLGAEAYIYPPTPVSFTGSVSARGRDQRYRSTKARG